MQRTFKLQLLYFLCTQILCHCQFAIPHPSPGTIKLNSKQLEDTYEGNNFQSAQRDSVEYPNHIEALNTVGEKYYSQENWNEALAIFQQTLQVDPFNVLALKRKGQIHYILDEYPKSVQYFERFLKLEPEPESSVSHLIALVYHHSGNLLKAEKWYLYTLEGHKDGQGTSALYFDFAVTLQHQGRVLDANMYYNRAIQESPTNAAAWLNIAALHHRHGTVADSIPNYKRALQLVEENSRLALMATVNLGVAYELCGLVPDAIVMYLKAKGIAEKLFPKASHAERNERELLQMHQHITRAKKKVADWSAYYEEVDHLINTNTELYLTQGKISLIMPFDSLLLPVSMDWRRRNAELYSQSYQVGPSRWRDNARFVEYGRRLSVGYLSYDFNDHPTAHLMEGLFACHTETIKSFAISYGKDDNSSYRRSIVSLCDEFMDISAVGHDQVVSTIESKYIQILVDAQAYTRGGRPEITALRPAPIQVSYLVFPGTMGNPAIDYIIVDKYVVPPEHAIHFSEKLVHMPYSYQVNYYKETDQNTLREANVGEEPLFGSKFVFANFNKVDKFEPLSFGVWMDILQQVPNSVLWLLRPSSDDKYSAVKHNVHNELDSRGIERRRVVFAGRIPKREHLKRHRFADLFLDTFLYGAHSTASDALRGGVPVLSLCGEGFPSRVSKSLLENLGLGSMVVNSVKAFSDMAVRLAKSTKLLHSFRDKLLGAKQHGPLFDTCKHTKNLERSYEMMWDVYSDGKPAMNLIVCNSKNKKMVLEDT